MFLENHRSEQATEGRRAEWKGQRQEEEKAGHSEWSDIEDTSQSKRHTSRKALKDRKDTREQLQRDQKTSAHQSQTAIHREGEGFFPRLRRITEGRELDPSSRRGSTTVKTTNAFVKRRKDPEEERKSLPRSATRFGYTSRPSHLGRHLNPSALSVLSSLTSASERSSGSNSTITQQSYNRRNTRKGNIRRHRQSAASAMPAVAERSPESGLSGKEIIPISPKDDDSTTHSSRYTASDSEAPETPSSRSTFPSPTMTRNPSHSVDGDPSDDVETDVRGASRYSPLDEHTNHANDDRRLDSPQYLQRRASSSGRRYNSLPAEDIDGGLDNEYTESGDAASSDRVSHHYRGRATLAHEHVSYPPSPSQYHAPLHSSSDAYAYLDNQDGHLPPAPEAPDLSKTTLTGYELLARELSDRPHNITPLYRKFEYLHHRVLLHLQDELSELEEHLRITDEFLTQLARNDSGSPANPASRRKEWYSGDHRRTDLLGRIFQKQEQYSELPPDGSVRTHRL